ncbi:MAG: acyl carrier protein [Thermodesulfobacteriota bacterium]|nr:acyl carrier protein [Thermodesulfobacteriota bacterium]
MIKTYSWWAGDLGIDSIDVFEMVVMVEKDYGVVINNKLTPVNGKISRHKCLGCTK